jgi:hypothetical protein
MNYYQEDHETNAPNRTLHYRAKSGWVSRTCGKALYSEDEVRRGTTISWITGKVWNSLLVSRNLGSSPHFGFKGLKSLGYKSYRLAQKAWATNSLLALSTGRWIRELAREIASADKWKIHWKEWGGAFVWTQRLRAVAVCFEKRWPDFDLAVLCPLFAS